MSSVTGRRGNRSGRVVLFAAGIVAFAVPAMAQEAGGSPETGAATPVDPERLALAREYVRESHMDVAMRGVFANMTNSMPHIGTDNANDAKTRQFVSSVSVGVDAAVPQLIEATTLATARVFTTQELKDLVAFYGTPSGQSMVAKMPMLMQQVTPVVFQIMPTVYQAADADYCRHVTCTEADHTRFQRLQAALSRGARPPPGSQ